ncbi:putative lipid II flippase FtsW [Gordonia neofelifaecis]|uniref:Probable peptidoglycan glycosyltransferase FtsW n=1 Tax=Gordonia neofelifaecis NRRL B-59395 TaxID=644548 RepID=F1YHM2_9ACTN|nr:putative lipid II flippase FtsW [Gordonia neofelifaecis]EGD55860.1 cell division protein FtsW [Gordonia neofelifaecis NRRL B-59395]
MSSGDEKPDVAETVDDTSAETESAPGGGTALDESESASGESAESEPTDRDPRRSARRGRGRTGRRDRRRPAAPTADPLHRLRVIRASDVKSGGTFLVNGVRNLLARPLTSFHLIVSITVILVALGLMMVLSASAVEGYAKDGSAYGMFTTQVMFVSLGLVLFYVAVRMPVRTIQKASLPILLISVVLLILVMIPGLGVAGGGARRWLSFGGLTLQPSELAKAALCMWGAAVLSTRDPRTSSTRDLIFPLIPVAFGVAFLVIIEPNQSTTMILGMIVATLLWFGGLPGRFFAAFGVVFAIAGVALAFAESYRAARIFSFLGRDADPLGADYQPNQAKFALADGGLFGKGLGQSTAKWNYLPNAHNDFIFAIIGEELGLVGGIIVLCLYLLLGYVGMRIARRSVDPFLRLMSATITVLFLMQAFINIGYVVGILPVTGIQLPILSYGGTSALTMLAMLGLLANAARHEPDAVAALAGPAPKGLSRLLRLPRPEAYRSARQPDRRRASSATSGRRPAPVRGPSAGGRREAPRSWATRPRTPAADRPRRGRWSGESSSGEIHYPARGARPNRSWQESRAPAPHERPRRAGRGEWENGRR